jgi:hypothetical protein
MVSRVAMRFPVAAGVFMGEEIARSFVLFNSAPTRP